MIFLSILFLLLVEKSFSLKCNLKCNGSLCLSLSKVLDLNLDLNIEECPHGGASCAVNYNYFICINCLNSKIEINCYFFLILNANRFVY